MGEGDITRREDPEAFARVLHHAISVLDEANVPNLVFGSIAVVTYGRPSDIGDVDLLVRPDDAQRGLDALGEAGFKTEKDDPRWLYKAFSEGVLVDLIFQVQGKVFLDDEVLGRAREVEFDGVPVRMVAPEDMMVIAAVSHQDENPDHWYNALAILGRTELDWDYVVRRASRSAGRVLSLLIYARADDIPVPIEPIRRLYEQVFPT